MRKLLFICSLIIASLQAQAQDSVATRPAPDIPRLFVSVDYGKLATYPFRLEDKLEGGIGFRIGKHFMPVFYAGYADISPDHVIENGTYNSSGFYFRAGLEYIGKLDPNNNLIVGLRYGQSKFTEEASYVITSELFDPVTQEIERTDLEASWAEIIAGSEMRLGYSPFYLGGYFSLRILIDRDEFDPVDTHTIPGYGRTFDKTLPAIQLYIKMAILR